MRLCQASNNPALHPNVGRSTRAQQLLYVPALLLALLMPIRALNLLFQSQIGIGIDVSIAIHLFTFLSIAALPFALRLTNQGLDPLVSILAFATLLAIGSVTVVNSLFVSAETFDIVGIPVHRFQIGAAYYIVVHTVAGAFLATLPSHAVHRWALFSSFGIAITVLYFSTGLLQPLDFEVQALEFSGAYLAIGDVLAVTALCALSTLKSWRWAVFFSLFALSLFSVGSRLSFYLFIALAPFQALWISRRSIRRSLYGVLLLLIVACVLILVISVFNLGNSLSGLGDTGRMLSIFDLSTDGSAVLRRQGFEIGMERLLANPLTGDYAGQLDYFHLMGAYLHNFLSYWQQYGLLPFALFSLLLVILLNRALFESRFSEASKALSLGAAIFLIASSLVGRSYVFPLIWILVGYVSVRQRYHSS